MKRRVRRAPLLALLPLLAAACASAGDDLVGVAEQPPLDRAVLVTGGAFFGSAGGTGSGRTFGGGAESGAAGGEAIPFASIVDVLRRGEVFQRLVADADPARRRRLRDDLLARRGDAELADFLREAQEGGFDLLLLVEELQDGPIESQGTNGRWPVTFATWILLGVGALIPDRTFESRASLRVSLRELQTGRVLHDLLLVPGPIELALTERTDWLGMALSIVVPPFWVGDDREQVAEAVRTVTERRLLLSMARDLKSEVVRRRLDDAAPASISLSRDGGARGGGARVVVTSRENLGVARLSGAEVGAADAERFAAALLASRTLRDGVFRYEAELPALAGTVQVLVATLRGGVASATFESDAAR